MTSPASPPPIRVIQAPGFGQELLDAVQPFIQAMQARRQLELQRQDLALRERDAKLRERTFEQHQREVDQATQTAAETGDLLRALALAGQAGNAAGMQPTSPTMGGGDRVPVGTLMPGAVPAAPRSLSDIFANAPAEAIPGALQLSGIDLGKILTAREGAAQSHLPTGTRHGGSRPLRADAGKRAQLCPEPGPNPARAGRRAASRRRAARSWKPTDA